MIHPSISDRAGFLARRPRNRMMTLAAKYQDVISLGRGDPDFAVMRSAGAVLGIEVLDHLAFQAREARIRMPIRREDMLGSDRGNVGHAPPGDTSVDTIAVQGVLPKLTDHPGRVAWLGPRLGEHNDEVYRSLLGLTVFEIAQLLVNSCLC